MPRSLPVFLALLAVGCRSAATSVAPSAAESAATAVAVPEPLPAAPAALAPAAAPALASAPLPPAPADEDGPRLDCKTFQGGPAPSPRSLCESVVARDPAPLIDEKGFAFVTQFESPADDADPAEGNMKRRVCGEEARRRVQRLLLNVRYKLAQGDATDPWVSCTGMRCELRGEGEWSTSGTLYFRRSKGKLVLDAWTEIERSLITPEVIARREAFLADGLRSLAGAPCAR